MITEVMFALPIAVSFVTVCMNIGVNFIFIFEDLKNVPQEILESSSIDGTNYFKKLFSIIIPMISPTLFFMVSPEEQAYWNASLISSSIIYKAISTEIALFLW